MSLLRVQNASKSFGKLHALKGIDLEVEKGETVAVIGPSGCGKTTLLRCLGLFDKIDSGEIYFEEKLILKAEIGSEPIVHVDLNRYHARVGIVFQHLYIWPHLTVLENLTLAPTKVLGLVKKEASEKGRELLVRMGVEDKIDHFPQTLSGGQLQRVALARALMMEPEILLLDEITSALDPELVGDLLDIIANLTKSGMTIIIVTHEMQFAADIANRIIFLDGGCVTEVGPPGRIFSSPHSYRLQDFIRRINHTGKLGVSRELSF